MLPDISFDYAVVEHEENIKVVRYSGAWKDLGTWNTFTEVMDAAGIGDVQFDGTCENSHVVNETDMPVIAMGLKNIVVAVSPDGILVADKVQSSYIKPLAENLNRQIRYAEKSWGEYKVIDVGAESLTIKVTLNAGTIISGSGCVVLDGETKSVSVGDVVEIPVGVKHTLIAETNLQAIEVQMGENIRIEDKILWEN